MVRRDSHGLPGNKKRATDILNSRLEIKETDEYAHEHMYIGLKERGLRTKK
jgi:hypothetical protein